MSNKLECKNIKKSYEDFELEVNFTIEKGDFVSIIGPSGCGKTTLLQIISGFVLPDSGQILVDGKDISTTAINKRNLGYVFQDYTLFEHLTVAKNISYSQTMRKKNKVQKNKLIKDYLVLVGLDGYEDRKVSTLSGGEKQRVSIARSLASKSSVLLLDEPLSALDAKLRLKLRQVLKDIHRQLGITIIYITHDQSEALSLSDKVIVLNKGKVVQYDTPEVLYNSPSTIFSATFMGGSNILDANIIPKIINKNENNKYGYVYKDIKKKTQILFRPEKVIIHQDPRRPFPEFLPHLLFKGAELVNINYEGDLYYYTFKWENKLIKAASSIKLSNNFVTLGIRTRDITTYEDGKLLLDKLSKL